MRSAIRTTVVGNPPARTGPVRIRGTHPRSIGRIARRSAAVLLIAAASAGLFWLVWIYGNGLRDPRYLDGWLLAAGIGAQLGFHVATATSRLSPRSVLRWKRVHIALGYLLIAAFVSHCDLSLPDTGFEWALGTGFALVTLSGIWGTWLAWFIKAQQRSDELFAYERIPARRAELSREVRRIVAQPDPTATRIALPQLPHDAWIAELFDTRLGDFFAGPRNTVAHIAGSHRPRERLTAEIDSLAAYVDQHGKEKLVAIRSLVFEKDRLDFLETYLWLNRAWLLVHVPVTYALIVLSVVHILVVYAFSSGAW